MSLPACYRRWWFDRHEYDGNETCVHCNLSTPQCPSTSGSMYGYQCARLAGHDGKHLVLKSETRCGDRVVGRTTVEW